MLRAILLFLCVSLTFQVLAQDSSLTQEEESKRRKAQIDQLEAELDSHTTEYKNPRRVFSSGKEIDGAVNSYANACLRKIEAMDNDNQPPEAKGSMYGSVFVYFEVTTSGEVRKINIEKSSGYTILDNAAQRAIEFAAPFPPFPQQVSARADVVAIVRKFTYDKHDDGTEPPVSTPP